MAGYGEGRAAPKTAALAQCYELYSLKLHYQGYLRAFVGIEVGSTVLMPDKDRPGEVYVGTVMKPC